MARQRLTGDRLLLALTLLAGTLSIIFILDDTGYPFDVRRAAVFQYLLREQDIAGCLLVMAIAIGAYLPGTRTAILRWVDVLARNPWPVAGVFFAMLCAAMFGVVRNHPLAGDEHLALFQSRAFAAGHLTGRFPPDLVFRLVPAIYQWRWLVISETTGTVAAIYWPGFSLLLVPFDVIGAPWACNPLLASLSLVLMARIAARLTNVPQAAGWTLLLALGSPGLAGMALCYFSMTAHLFLNLLFAWLLLERTPKRLWLAGVVGSFALVQSNPVPHMLFALPWIAHIARQPNARSQLLALGAGYAPLCLVLGLGWWLFLRHLQEHVTLGPYPEGGGIWERLANLAWYLHIEFRAVLAAPGYETLAKRIGEQVRLWSWAVPGLPLLALAGWWQSRGNVPLRLFGLSLASTLIGYLVIGFDQGYGWGARYVHPAWGALPILASVAIVSVTGAQAERLRSFVARCGVLSLVFATALRLFQIGLFMDEQLALRPPFEKGERQIVFIAPNLEFYSQDFVQNDPFLREPVIFMMSRGLARDRQEIIQRRFPNARLTYDGIEGQVWRLR
jgi:hypothetical protein